MSKRKYIYWYVVQGNYGYGWEDIDHIDKHKQHTISPSEKPVTALRYAIHICHEARLGNSEAQYRIINRREVLAVRH